MEALRQAIERALEEGNLLPDQEMEQMLDGTPEERDARMKQLIDELIDRLTHLARTGSLETNHQAA